MRKPSLKPDRALTRPAPTTGSLPRQQSRLIGTQERLPVRIVVRLILSRTHSGPQPDFARTATGFASDQVEIEGAHLAKLLSQALHCGDQSRPVTGSQLFERLPIEAGAMQQRHFARPFQIVRTVFAEARVQATDQDIL